jgi:exoribonuclease II
MNKETLKHKISKKLRRAAKTLQDRATIESHCNKAAADKDSATALAYEHIAKWLENTQTRLI